MIFLSLPPLSLSHTQGGGGGGKGPQYTSDDRYRGGGGGGGSYSSGIIGGAATGGATDTVEGRIIIKETTHTLADVYFTSCGAHGNNGPAYAQCQSTYAGSEAGRMLVQVTNGVQLFRIPVSGSYKITAYGARGGHGLRDNPNYSGGHGAKAWGTFNLKKGDVLSVVIGQPGNYASEIGASETGGGGGGGTFVWVNSEEIPLVVAGGGGGELANGIMGIPMFVLCFF